MPFKVTKLPDEPIIICTITDPLDAEKELETIFAALAQVVEGLAAPIYRILDIRHLTVSFSDIFLTLAEDTKPNRPGSLADPRIRPILVASGALAELAVNAVQQEQYGGLFSHMFTDLDEALAYARADLLKQAA